MTAAERDEILSKHDRVDVACTSSHARIEELQAALMDAQTQIHANSFQQDKSEKAALKAAQAVAKSETAMRIQLDRALAENAQLRETTVASERAKADAALTELKQARAETERLDSENARDLGGNPD